MTKTVAETIRDVLKEKSVEVDCFYCRELEALTVKSYDCLIAGGPTMAFRPSMGITEFLNNLTSGEFSGKKATVFDTQLQMLVSGNATKGIEKKLKSLGFDLFKSPLVVYVESKGKGTWQFKSGELEKAKIWAQEVAKELSA